MWAEYNLTATFSPCQIGSCGPGLCPRGGGGGGGGGWPSCQPHTLLSPPTSHPSCRGVTRPASYPAHTECQDATVRVSARGRQQDVVNYRSRHHRHRVQTFITAIINLIKHFLFFYLLNHPAPSSTNNIIWDWAWATFPHPTHICPSDCNKYWRSRPNKNKNTLRATTTQTRHPPHSPNERFFSNVIFLFL